MSIEQLKIYVYNSSVDHPLLKEEFEDLYQLCLDEIEEGGSVQNEINHCYNSIQELINN